MQGVVAVLSSEGIVAGLRGVEIGGFTSLLVRFGVTAYVVTGEGLFLACNFSCG